MWERCGLVVKTLEMPSGRGGREPIAYLCSMFSTDEKALIGDALKLYAQMIGSQYGQAEMQGIIPVIKDIMAKLDKAGAAAAPAGKAPFGISDDWFQNVCQTCPKLGAAGCDDPVTAKWPGKCDPILTWERRKLLSERG